MKKLGKIFHTFDKLEFTSKDFDAQEAARLYYGEELSYTETAARLSTDSKTITRPQVNVCLKSHIDLIREVFTTAKRASVLKAVNNAVLKRRKPVDISFIPDEFKNNKMVFNIFLDVFRDVPAMRYLPKSDFIPKKLKKAAALFFPEVREKGYLSLSKILKLDYCSDQLHIARLLQSIFIPHTRCVILQHNDELFIVRNFSPELLKFVMDHTDRPLTYNEIHARIDANPQFTDESCKSYMKKADFIFRLNKDLWGRKCDLSYPDKINDIQAFTRELMLTNHMMELDDVLKYVRQRFPAVRNGYELRTYLRGCPDLILMHTKVLSKQGAA